MLEKANVGPPVQLRVCTHKPMCPAGKQFCLRRGSGAAVEYLLSDGTWSPQCYKRGRAANGFYNFSEAERVLDILAR